MSVQNPPGFLQNAGDTHTAAQLRMYTASLQAGMYSSATSLRARGGVHPGFGQELVVTQAGSPGMSVLVEPGACSVPGSLSATQGNYFVVNDAQVTLSVTAAHATLPRIDIVVINVNDSQYAGATNNCELKIVAGTPASSPVAPAAPDNSITIAQIAVAAADTAITNGEITDTRFYMAAVGGVIPVRNAASLPASTEISESQLVWQMDTNKLSIWNGTAFAQIYPVETVTKHKLADESVTSSTTFQADDHLALAYATGVSYVLDGWLPMEGSTSGDFKAQLAFTASSVTRLDYSLTGIAVAGADANAFHRSVAQLNATTSPSGSVSIGTASSNWVPVLVHGILIASAAGTLTLEWAQDTSSGTATILKKGGWLRLTPIVA